MFIMPIFHIQEKLLEMSKILPLFRKIIVIASCDVLYIIFLGHIHQRVHPYVQTQKILWA